MVPWVYGDVSPVFTKRLKGEVPAASRSEEQGKPGEMPLFRKWI